MVETTIFAYFCVFCPEFPDLLSTKYLLKNANFYSTIGLMNVHIERYLRGGAEFKPAINCIMVHSLSVLHYHHLSQVNPNHTQPPGCEPLPSCEGCELNKQTTATTITASNDESLPLPLLRDVGRFFPTTTATAPAPDDDGD